MTKRILFILSILFIPSCQWLPEVGKVSLSESSVTLKVGGSRQLSATVEPAAAEYEGITWTSSDPSVAIVTNGTISARKVGTTTISATAAGVTSNPCQVTVDATHVTGISLSNSSVEITEGESTTLKATVSPSDATDPSFIWGSDNTSVATVQNGTIVAISPGTANISVRTTDGNKTATCKVTVKSKVIDVTGITLSQSSISIKEEKTLQLKATVKPSNATNQEVSWSSGDEGIATVASDGTVTGVTEGTTTITAKSADGKVSTTCKVTVMAEYVDFPDPNFRKYMVENFDLNKNGKISLKEAKKVTRIEVYTTEIESLDGLQFLTELSYLDVHNPCAAHGSFDSETGLWIHTLHDDTPPGKLSSLDLSQNLKLTYLSCSNNQLTELNVCNNTELKELYCSYNKIKSLDLRCNKNIEKLSCSDNKLSHLEIAGLLKLSWLSCSNNPLGTIDLSTLVNLRGVNCDANLLSNINLSQNTSLEYLQCDHNRIDNIDLSSNTLLETLYCGSNQLTSLDVSKNTALETLRCYSNQLTSLDVSKNTALETLWCSSNQLTSLDVTKNTALETLWCSSNQLTSLDVTKNTALTRLDCSSNQLTSLDVSKNTALTDLSCYSNQLTTLDVSKNKSLTNLDCSPMSTLKILYVSSGQSIKGVTVDRSTFYIPYDTKIEEVSSPKGTASNPYSVSEITTLLTSGIIIDDDVFIKGKVSAILYDYSTYNGTGTFWLSDDGEFKGSEDKKSTTEVTHDFECYGVYWFDNQKWVEGNGQVRIGDEVVVCGKTTVYNGMAETSNKKAYIYSINGYKSL